MEDSVGVLSPKYNLDPPHYDGIQSLCLMGDLLFSGSRDTCIKKWDLAEQQQKHVSFLTVDAVLQFVALVSILIRAAVQLKFLIAINRAIKKINRD